LHTIAHAPVSALAHKAGANLQLICTGLKKARNHVHIDKKNRSTFKRLRPSPGACAAVMGLENWRAFTGTVGSNPTLSAI
jgi:hypothetical protein